MVSSFQGLGAMIGFPRAAENGAWDRLLTQGLDFLRQKLCALHGHDQLLHFESDRMFLRCTSCGFETPGWKVGERPPRVCSFGEPRRRCVPFRPDVRYRNTA